VNRLFRLTSYILLLVFGSSMGDWPYVDELFEQAAHHREERLMAQSLGSAGTQHSTDIFEILVGIQLALVAPTAIHHPTFHIGFPTVVSHFQSRSPELFFRPPAGAIAMSI
jgi:hypothetical protein